MSRMGRARGRPPAGPVPFRVDLIPLPGGFSDDVEEEIIRFLESRAGAFDILGQIATGGDFLRYCFSQRADAEAFQRQFLPMAEKAIYCEAFVRPEKV
jgi:hypothetical protein